MQAVDAQGDLIGQRAGADADAGAARSDGAAVTAGVPAGGLADAARCSAKGCREPATVDLQWRNPRLHDAARSKHWLACAAHAEHLAEFLARRGFLLGRAPLLREAGAERT